MGEEKGQTLFKGANSNDQQPYEKKMLELPKNKVNLNKTNKEVPLNSSENGLHTEKH